MDDENVSRMAFTDSFAPSWNTEMGMPFLSQKTAPGRRSIEKARSVFIYTQSRDIVSCAALGDRCKTFALLKLHKQVAAVTQVRATQNCLLDVSTTSTDLVFLFYLSSQGALLDSSSCHSGVPTTGGGKL